MFTEQVTMDNHGRLVIVTAEATLFGPYIGRNKGKCCQTAEMNYIVIFVRKIIVYVNLN